MQHVVNLSQFFLYILVIVYVKWFSAAVL